VRYGRDWVEKLDRLRNIAGAVGTVVGAAFALVAIIIIGTTIRMAVLQRSREITIMRLVGATDRFIRMPFLLEGLVKGTLGGVLAVGLSLGAWALINSALIRAAFFSPAQAALGIVAGGLLGLVGSALAVGRHLRSV
jgi:cell division transport system permease protein